MIGETSRLLEFLIQTLFGAVPATLTVGTSSVVAVLSMAISFGASVFVVVTDRLLTAVSSAFVGPTSTVPVDTLPILLAAVAFSVVAVTLFVAPLASVMLPAVAVRLTVPAFITLAN